MRWISSIGGVIATAAALAVIVSLPSGAPPLDTADLSLEEATSVELPAPPIVIEQQVEHDLSVPSLGDDLTDVLEESGYTQFVGVTELSELLSDDVAQVLISNEAVLVIPSEEGS